MKSHKLNNERSKARKLLFFGKRGEAFDPASLFDANQVGVILDPSRLDTMFQDVAGTIPITADGQVVARINDISPNGFYAYQTTFSKRAVYHTDENDILHWLEFDGVDDGYEIDISSPNIDKLQSFIGYYATAKNARLLMSDGFSASDFWFNVNFNGVTSCSTLGLSTSVSSTTLTRTIGTFIIDKSVRAFVSLIPGTQNETLGSNSGNFLFTKLYLGKESNDTDHIEGNIYSLILRFGANLNSSQISGAENYTKSKTGV